MKVDLPEPLAPMIAQTNPATLDRDAHAPQRVDARLAELVVLVDVLDANDRLDVRKSQRRIPPAEGTWTPRSSSRRLARTTAIENVQLPTMYSPVDKLERGKRAKEALALVSLADRAHHVPSQLSGGQQQRVAIARALVNHPSFLADEPTGNLDSRTAVEIIEIFQNLNERGLTIVLVTHEHDIAQFAKRVLTFRRREGPGGRACACLPGRADVLRALPTLED